MPNLSTVLFLLFRNVTATSHRNKNTINWERTRDRITWNGIHVLANT